MHQSKLFIYNTLIIWMSRIASVFPQLVLIPFLIGTIGETGYGIYALVWSLMLSIEQLQKSLQSGVVKYSAGFLVNGQTNEVNKLISSSFIFSLFLAVLVCTGTLVLAAFHNDPTGQIDTALIVVAIMVLFIFPLTPYVAVIQSRQCYYVGAICETASKYIGLLIIVTWFHIIKPSVEALIIIMAAMLFFSRLVQVPIAHRLIPGIKNRPSLFDGKSFRLITAFGAATVLAAMCIAVNSTGIRWLMGTLTSTSYVAHLVIMLMPGILLAQIIQAMTITVMPATSAYEATRNQLMLQELLIRGMRYTMIIVLAVLMVASLLMRNALVLWLGHGYVFLAPYTLVLFASASFMLSTSTAHHMLKGLGKLRTVILIYFLGLVVVPISLILIVLKTWHDPYVAVTSGLAAGHLVCGGLQIWFSTKTVCAEIRHVLTRAYAQPLIVASTVYGALLAFTTYVGIDVLVIRVFISVLIILLFFSGCYIFIFTSAERDHLKEMVQTAKNKIVPNKGMPKAR